MGIQNLDQIEGTSVEGKTEMPDFTFRFFLQSPVEAVQPFIGITVAAVLNGMEQVEIKVIYAAPFQLLIEYTVPVFRPFEAPGGKLGGKHELIPRVALDQGFFDGFLGITAVINIGGVKVIHPGLHIGIHHAVYMADIDDSVFFRQAHEAEPKLWHDVQIDTHSACFLSAPV